MDSITHALYKAITTDDAHQRKVEAGSSPRAGDEVTAGLQPISRRKHVHDAYADATPTDFHIALERGPELLALQLEFIAAGYCPPAGLNENGADVIISPGRIDVYVATDDGQATWSAILEARTSGRPGDYAKKVRWEEQVA
jgi:hypothetical protein